MRLGRKGEARSELERAGGVRMRASEQKIERKPSSEIKRENERGWKGLRDEKSAR